MGTRHLQTVITKTGEVKVNQYGQWDGYPSGQGIDILNYLRNANLDKYQKNLEKIKKATQKQLDKVNATENCPSVYPYLSRDCGSKIHKLIENGHVKFVVLASKDAEGWCEGFYTIDFSTNSFTSEFYGIKHTYLLNELPTDEDYLKIMEPPEE